MSIHEINPLCDPRWSELVERHPRASVFHSTAWLEALRSAYGYKPVVISTSSQHLQLTNGLVFCCIRSWLTGNRLVSLPFADHCAPLVNNSDECDEMLVSVKRRVDEDGWKYVEVRPYWYVPSLHTNLSKSLTYCVHRLDLSGSTEQLFQSFHRDCVQRKVRRAVREKLCCEDGNSEHLLQDFYRLLVMTRRRQSLPPQPLAWFRCLVASFGSGLKIRVAYKDGLPVASILTLFHKKSMVYKYGCSDARFHPYGGIALLLWNAIQDAKGNGYEEVDMGRSDIDNLGLIVFKEHWGARRAELSYWTYPQVSQSRCVLWQRRFLRGVVAVSPDVALQAMGSFLYGHIG